MTEADIEVLWAMEKYGGGFEMALARAARRADSDNLRRIKAAWPEYWSTYEAMAAAEFGDE